MTVLEQLFEQRRRVVETDCVEKLFLLLFAKVQVDDGC